MGGTDVSFGVAVTGSPYEGSTLTALVEGSAPGDSGGGAGGVRVSVAFESGAFDDSPTWTDITAHPNLVAGYTIDRGRIEEFDRTDTGTATVSIRDRDGILDPTNSTGPYYGLIEPDLQIKIDLLNPVTDTFQTRFRGFIEELDYAVDPSTHQDVNGDTVGITALTISCVDLFGPLTDVEMQPGAFGDDPPAAYADTIFFDNATAHDRVVQALGNAGVPTDRYVVFTLNVNMPESTYAPSDSVLQPIQDAADAEFPTVGNVYVDRLGRLAVHGRLAKFDPDGTAADAGTTAWPFTRWKAGDGAAVAASPSDTAHIREFAYNRGKAKIRNSAFCTPVGIRTADVPDQYVQDLPSIAQHGFKSWSAENLLVESGILTGNDAKTECLLFASFIVANYKNPRNRPTQVTFRSIRPTAEGAAANWQLLTELDIADIMELTIRGPGDGPTGFIFNAEEFSVEGVHEEAQPLNGEYADVTLSVDLSPQALFTDPVGLDGV